MFGTDWRDLALLVLKFPELKEESGAVKEGLVAAGAASELLTLWQEIVATEIEAEDDDDF